MASNQDNGGTTAKKGRWLTVTVICIMFAFAATAFGLSLAAFLDNHPNNGHQDWARRNVYAKSDLVVDGETRHEGHVFANSDLYVGGVLEAGALFKPSKMAWNQPIVINQTGNIEMADIFKTSSCVRIDTPNGTVTLKLPKANSVPFQWVSIFVSQVGAGASINLHVADGDVFVNSNTGSATSVNPVGMLPRHPGQPDSLMLSNDGISVWS